MEKNDDLNYYKVQTYGKSELAQLYNPVAQPKAVAATLNRWIEKNSGLSKALTAIGYDKMRHTFLSREVVLIFEYLEEP